ncbi:MAG: hypothetical protein ACREU0_11885, partial [Burkholderiales bacterium]
IGSVDVLKSITGGDFVRYERKYRNAEEGFIYEGMVVIASNEPLASIDHTSGLSRRQVVIEFSKRFSESDRTFFEAYGGEQKILDEIPEIINWALALSADDVTNRFTNLPEKVKQSTQEALFDQNPVSDWISENLIACHGNFVAMGIKLEIRKDGKVEYEDADEKLYPNYLRWCQETGKMPKGLKTFRRNMKDMMVTLGFIVEFGHNSGRTARGCTGIRLRYGAERWNS